MSSSSNSVYLCTDDRMLLHRPVNWKVPNHFPMTFDECSEGYTYENPARLEFIRDRLRKMEERLARENHELGNVFIPLKCELATREEIMLAHTDATYIDRLAETEYWSKQDCVAAGERDSDMYYCPDSWQAARLACGGVLRCVDAVLSEETSHCRALAIVRPPGHHACQSQEMGFCFLNSVAVSAKYALDKLPESSRRVVILDWDIHHGNGTQELTYADPNILYISLHRYTGRKKNGFFPCTGHSREIGEIDVSEGTNLNVAWTAKGMGNAEYAAALSKLILPVIAAYDPGLVLVSCGLDAAAGDLIGDCELTASFYHAMTRSLLTVIGPDTPIVVALEGGYTMHIIADCMESVSLALLNRYYTGSQTSILPTQCNEVRSSDEKLADAREILREYYPYAEPGETNSIFIHLRESAIRNINASIEWLQSCSRWEGTLKLNKLTKSKRQRHLTALEQRPYNTRARKESDSSNEDLDMALRGLLSLSIGTVIE